MSGPNERCLDAGRTDVSDTVRADEGERALQE